MEAERKRIANELRSTGAAAKFSLPKHVGPTSSDRCSKLSENGKSLMQTIEKFQCYRCKKRLSPDNFWKGNNWEDGDGIRRSGTCKKCSKARNKERKKHFPVYHQRYRAKKYGMTLEEYNQQSELQQHCCKLCGKHKDQQGQKGALVIDHDHRTGYVRGLICHNCNVSLGLLGDNETTLKNMLKYLRQSRAKPLNPQWKV
jgi:hypothetical protein